jgi:hypothetical protein
MARDAPVTSLRDRVARTEMWIEARPEWLRPILYGPALLLVAMFARGALVLGPILLVALILASDAPLQDVASLVFVFAIAIGGSAAGGLAYTVIGRYLRTFRYIGPYIAGIVTLFPYMFSVMFIVRAIDHEAIIAAPTSDELFAAIVMSGFFGSMLGHAWAGRDSRHLGS